MVLATTAALAVLTPPQPTTVRIARLIQATVRTAKEPLEERCLWVVIGILRFLGPLPTLTAKVATEVRHLKLLCASMLMLHFLHG